jgi:hypothetical protein
VAGGGDAQHGRLTEPVHEPALRDGAERVGESERARHAAGLGERAGRLASQQQDREDVHADRERPEGRRDQRAAGARDPQQRSVTTHCA